MNRCFLLLIFLMSCGLTTLPAQEVKRPLPERIISLTVKNEALKSVMDKVAQQGQFTFSYPSSLIEADKKITLSVSKKTVREILPLLFGDKISWKVRGNYVILAVAPRQTSREKPATYLLSGYVIDGQTGEKVPSVSIYEGDRMISTVTNKYGFFTIRMEEPGVRLKLKVSKESYQDTLITVNGKDNQSIEIMIHPVEQEVKSDTLISDNFPAMDFLIPTESSINTKNISDTLYRKWQVSFLPVAGTNYRLSGNVINDYSLNILGGYARGTRKAELAGLFNVNREDVKYAQVAGVLNADGGAFSGAQVAGVLNMVRKKVHGVQVAGMGNLAWDTVTGVQTAGFFNFNRGYTNAVQVAGFLNTNLDTTRGVQLAGFLNTHLKPYQGVQVAGFLNASIQEAEGVQISGFGNVVVKDFQGVQVSGFFNATVKEMKGTQITSFLNYAKKVRGTQIGLINISDSCSGVPVGLLSFVRSGYHRLELYTDEIFYLNAGIRTGTISFHNLLFAGMGPVQSDTLLWTFGYGLGTSLKLGKTTFLDFDLSAQQINKGIVGPKINLLAKFSPGVEQRLTKGIHLHTGPVLSAQITNRNYANYPEIFSGIQPHIFYSDKLNASTKVRMWIGWKLGIRFF